MNFFTSISDLNPAIMKAVEQLNYRVTVGDVAAKAGLGIQIAEPGLLTLASVAGGHLQVSETGEVVYLFSKNFRSILRNKFWRLKFLEWWQKVWRVLFYLFRISFAIILITSIILIFITIGLILIAVSTSGRDSSNGRSSGGGSGFFFLPYRLLSDVFWLLSWDHYSPNYNYSQHRKTSQKSQKRAERNESEMNFLEAVFSFIFGDGNPNANLEERRWQTIGSVIKQHQGAVVAEQIAPYLDELGTGYARDYEEYMLPVLTRFNGRPEVSSEGQLVYHFPDLQTTVNQQEYQLIEPYLIQEKWRFSKASTGQILGAIGLGSVNIIGALMLKSLLTEYAALGQSYAWIAFVQGIYPILLGYGLAYLVVPLIRYFWNQWRNDQIEVANSQRYQRTLVFTQPDPTLEHKLNYARQFAAETLIHPENIVYTTEEDLVEQEAAKLEAESQPRLNSPREGDSL